MPRKNNNLAATLKPATFASKGTSHASQPLAISFAKSAATLAKQEDQAAHIEKLYARFLKAKEQRASWEALWNECYTYALPQKEGCLGGLFRAGKSNSDKLFDATALDATDQLAASMFAELTPPFSKWFTITSGSENLSKNKDIAEKLSRAADIIQYHFDRSNFALEMHQCYLDLVTVGTASLLFEEAGIGENTAFRFTAVPLSELYVDEGISGALDTTFRLSTATYDELSQRFPEAHFPEAFTKEAQQNPDIMLKIIEAVTPLSEGGYDYTAFIATSDFNNLQGKDKAGQILRRGTFAHSPFINFRWQKVPSEVYGRSPIMKALPDIKTANKVVELILKNATIAVTGIWQAEDDGVLNPANIRLTPGAIIPKAVGSKGLTPLEPAGNFDLSQLVLKDLRDRIKHALLGDRLGQIASPKMTATEVLERSAEMARILGATYGRLQSELLNPLIQRALSILVRRGEITPLFMDGRFSRLQYASPLAQTQAKKDASNTLSWLSSVASMGAAGLAAVDFPAAARWLGLTLGVPPELIKNEDEAKLATGLNAIGTAVSALGNLATGAASTTAPTNAAQPKAAPALSTLKS